MCGRLSRLRDFRALRRMKARCQGSGLSRILTDQPETQLKGMKGCSFQRIFGLSLFTVGNA